MNVKREFHNFAIFFLQAWMWVPQVPRLWGPGNAPNLNRFSPRNAVCLVILSEV